MGSQASTLVLQRLFGLVAPRCVCAPGAMQSNPISPFDLVNNAQAGCRCSDDQIGAVRQHAALLDNTRQTCGNRRHSFRAATSGNGWRRVATRSAVAGVGNAGGAWQRIPRWRVLATLAALGNAFRAGGRGGAAGRGRGPWSRQSWQQTWPRGSLSANAGPRPVTAEELRPSDGGAPTDPIPWAKK